MATNENLIPIPGRLHSVATEGHVAGADEIIDDNLSKDQQTINAEVNAALGEGGTVDEKIAEAIDDALEDVAFIDDSESSPAVVPGFDPTTDTVHITAQTLSETQKAQVRTNIGLGDVDAKINEAVASEASQRAAAVSGVQSSVNAEAARAQAAEEQLRTLYNNLQQSQPIPVTALPATGEAGKIYRLAGTNSYADYMYAEGALTTPIKMAEYDNAIDDEPTAGSDNLVKSGGVYKEISVYDAVPMLGVKEDNKFMNHNGTSVSYNNYRLYSFNVSDIDYVKVITPLRGENLPIWTGFADESFVKASDTRGTTVLTTYDEIVDVRNYDVLYVNVYSLSNTASVYRANNAKTHLQDGIDSLQNEIDIISGQQATSENINLIDPDNAENGVWNGETAVDDNAYQRTKNAIPIDPSKHENISMILRTEGFAYCGFYGEDGTYISGLSASVANSKVTTQIPRNARAIRVSIAEITVSQQRTLNDVCIAYSELLGDSFSEYQKERFVKDTSLGNGIKEMAASFDVIAPISPSGNNILPNDEILGCWDNNNYGAYVNNSSCKCTPDFVKIPSGLSYIPYKNGYLVNNILFVILFFDKDKNYLGVASTTSSSANLPTRAGYEYVKCWFGPYGDSIKIQQLNMSHFSLSVVQYNGFDFYNGKRLVQPDFVVSSLRGKTIVNFGDSIFDYGYPEMDISSVLARYTGAKVANCAFGGCRMSGNSGNYGAFSMNSLAYAIRNNNWSAQDLAAQTLTDFAEKLEMLKTIDFSLVDVVTISFGTNDFTANVPLDNNTNTNVDYFADSLRYSIETLLGGFPNLRIVLLTPTYRFWINAQNEFIDDSNTRENSLGYLLKAYADKIKEVAKEYNVQVIDDYNIGIGKFNRTQFFPLNDGTHHNYNGKCVIAANISKKIY